jgi:repressor of nif and glnA expression
MIEEILQAAAPRVLPPAAIRKALQEKGVALAFTSIRHALWRLEARKAARQVGKSRKWRRSAAG